MGFVTTPPLPAGAALAQACTDLLTAATSAGGGGFDPVWCKRTLDGRPPPSCGRQFVAVHHAGRRAGKSTATALDEVFNVSCTVTVRLEQPFDREWVHEDDLERLANVIKAVLHKDVYDFRVIRAANILANFRTASAPDGVRAVGWAEPLRWEGDDEDREVSVDWFQAEMEAQDSYRQVGLVRRIRFSGARRLQALATMGY